MVNYNSQDYLLKKIEELEDKLHQLRVSRRILMNLLEKLEKEKKIAISQLTKENKKLKIENARYMRKLMNSSHKEDRFCKN